MSKENKQTKTTPESHEISILAVSYDVRIHSLRMDGDMKGTASVNLNDQFAVRGVSIMDENGTLSVRMPGYQLGNEYKEVFSGITDEARAAFDKSVLDAYYQALSGQIAKQSQASTEPLPLKYNIQIQFLNPGDGTVKGRASVTLNDQFVIPRVNIMEGTHGLFVSMPGFRGGNGQYKDYCFPCTKDARIELDKAVLDAYNHVLTQNQKAGQELLDGQQMGDTHIQVERGEQKNIQTMGM